MKEVNLSPEAKSLKKGEYEHYKGGRYQVLGVGVHSETLEEMVVYRSARDGEIWLRPLTMFLEMVVVAERKMPRFRFLGKSKNS